MGRSDGRFLQSEVSCFHAGVCETDLWLAGLSRHDGRRVHFP